MRIYLLLAIAAAASFIGSNCGGSGVGDPCVPEDEYLTTHSGFSVGEVNVESRSFQCLTRVCLVNHFRGRVSCPYGQVEDTYEDDPRGPIEDSGRSACAGNDVSGTDAAADANCPPGPDGDRGSADDPPCYVCDENSGSDCSDPSCLPGGNQHARTCRVPTRDGSRIEDRVQVPVDPQFEERTAASTVYCSCRCGPPEGAEEDNARYCECPSGYECLPLVDDLDLGKGQLAGKYCVQSGTEYDRSDPPITACTGSSCGSTIERVIDGNLVEEGRNPGTTCQPSGAVCEGGTYCCDQHQLVQNNGDGTWPDDWDVSRSPCDEVGVRAEVDGTSYTVCP